MAVREIIEMGIHTTEHSVPDHSRTVTLALGLSSSGITVAGPGYYIERENHPDCQFLFCYAGEGRVWIDKAWATCRAGQLYWMPPRVHHKYQSRPDGGWGFCWIFYHPTSGGNPAGLDESATQLASADPWPLHYAISGLYQENASVAELAALDLWAQVLHHYIQRSGSGEHAHDPLAQMWKTVDMAIDKPWSLGTLAQLAEVNTETLRTLSVRHRGRPPMQHVTFLRIGHARMLLRSTSLKLPDIAARVGFGSAFAMSRAFLRTTGVTPGRYRAGRPAIARDNDQ